MDDWILDFKKNQIFLPPIVTTWLCLLHPPVKYIGLVLIVNEMLMGNEENIVIT